MDINWPEKNTAELELFFSTDAKSGLTPEQYSRAKEQYGENIIDSEIFQRQNFYGPSDKRKNIKAMLQSSFGATGILCSLTGIILAAIGFDAYIFIFLPFYALLSGSAFILDVKAEKKYEYLYKTARPKALVIRNDKRKKVFMENIVPGDLILLSAGDIVPADSRIVSADGFSCVSVNGEGELIKTDKTAEAVGHAPKYTDAPSANIAYASEIAHGGSASAIVIATGQNTYTAKKNGDGAGFAGINKPEPPFGRSIAQKYARKISRGFFLASVFLFLILVISGILQRRDVAAVILTCLSVSAACFSEQLPVIADFAVIRGMHRLAKSGILIKKPSALDEINDIDTLIAKKNESFTQDKMRVDKISGYEVSIGNTPEIGYILSCMAACSNVAVRGSRVKNKIRYSGAAVDVAVFEALEKCGLDYDGISRVYQRLGKIIYNPANGIKSAVVIKDGKFNLVCFGEAFNILKNCARRTDVMGRLSEFDARGVNVFRGQIGDLYKEHDLVMAVAAKNLTRGYAERINSLDSEAESGLTFLGTACFSEPKTSAVFESVDYLKKSGINPVMLADSDNAYTKSAAVKLGIVKNLASAHMMDDAKINDMGDSLFYINADKFRLFAAISQNSLIKLLKALNFKKKFPAVTINSAGETALLGEPCAAFAPANAETDILKNKASVITKNLSVSTILKTVKGSVLIYRNICKITQLACSMFISQYLLVLFAILLNGAYILNPAQIIWAGTCTGFMLAVSMCFEEENSKWHIVRNEIKEYKKQKKFIGKILKYGFVYGALVFASAAASFFACLAIQGNGPAFETIKAYINSGAQQNSADIAAAQTAAFASYVAACVAAALRCINGPRFFDAKKLKNKIFITVSSANIFAVTLAVFWRPVGDFLGFGEIGAAAFAVSAAVGLCPFIFSGLVYIFLFRFSGRPGL